MGSAGAVRADLVRTRPVCSRTDGVPSRSGRTSTPPGRPRRAPRLPGRRHTPFEFFEAGPCHEQALVARRAVDEPALSRAAHRTETPAHRLAYGGAGHGRAVIAVGADVDERANRLQRPPYGRGDPAPVRPAERQGEHDDPGTSRARPAGPRRDRAPSARSRPPPGLPSRLGRHVLVGIQADRLREVPRRRKQHRPGPAAHVEAPARLSRKAGAHITARPGMTIPASCTRVISTSRYLPRRTAAAHVRRTRR